MYERALPLGLLASCTGGMYPLSRDERAEILQRMGSELFNLLAEVSWDGFRLSFMLKLGHACPKCIVKIV